MKHASRSGGVALVLTLSLGSLSGCGGANEEVAYPPQPAPTPMGSEGTAAAGPGSAVPGPTGSTGASTTPTTQAPVGIDPLNALDANYMADRSQTIIAELIRALTPAQRARIEGIPLVVDPTKSEINAFAACHDGRALMAVTAGMFDVLGHLAQAKAHDQRFGTQKTAEYIQFIAQNQRPDEPVLPPPSGFIPAANAVDATKVQLQHQIFDEALAFVLGHELGHHYLGHLPCTGSPGFLGTAELAREASSLVPLFNQPNELGADVAGTGNVLSAGTARAAQGQTAWTEAGAYLVMEFFVGLAGPGAFEFAFERSHPPPQLRIPVVQQTAATWRATGGRVFTIPLFGG
jgi:hypothetical protein